LIYDQATYHDYEGVALNLDEQKRLIVDLGDKRIMLLRTRGTLTAGANGGRSLRYHVPPGEGV